MEVDDFRNPDLVVVKMAIQMPVHRSKPLQPISGRLPTRSCCFISQNVSVGENYGAFFCILTVSYKL